MIYTTEQARQAAIAAATGEYKTWLEDNSRVVPFDPREFDFDDDKGFWQAIENAESLDDKLDILFNKNYKEEAAE